MSKEIYVVWDGVGYAFGAFHTEERAREYYALLMTFDNTRPLQIDRMSRDEFMELR